MLLCIEYKFNMFMDLKKIIIIDSIAYSNNASLKNYFY